MLVKQNEHQKTGKMIKEMWGTRRNKMEYEKRNKKATREVVDNNRITYSDPGPKRDGREKIRLQEKYGDSVGIIFGNNRGI